MQAKSYNTDEAASRRHVYFDKTARITNTVYSYEKLLSLRRVMQRSHRCAALFIVPLLVRGRERHHTSSTGDITKTFTAHAGEYNGNLLLVLVQAWHSSRPTYISCALCVMLYTSNYFTGIYCRCEIKQSVRFVGRFHYDNANLHC